MKVWVITDESVFSEEEMEKHGPGISLVGVYSTREIALEDFKMYQCDDFVWDGDLAISQTPDHLGRTGYYQFSEVEVMSPDART